ncbi:MAG: cytochrome c [Acidimicrobiia bacterium]|nr:cytochrome c [Acidimicrobiia bacterium]
MRQWVEAVLALGVVMLLGLGLFLFAGESPGGSTPDASAPISFDAEAAARGEVLAEAQGCLQCHTVDGTLGTTGPTWKGLAGSSRPVEGGGFVTADDTYLFNSIVDPDSQVVTGYQPVMPAFYADQLSEQEVGDLVEYIKSLSS